MSDDALRDARASRPTTPGAPAPSGSPSPPGFFDALGDDVLAAIAEDYLALLGTATTIHDRDGRRAFGRFPAQWCAYLDGASRDVGDGCGGTRSACQDSCWQSCRAAIESGDEVEEQCGSGIEMFAVPIRAGGRIVGAINAALGEPPRDGRELAELAARFGVEQGALAQRAATYPRRSLEAVDLAKQRLRRAAELIGEMVARRAAERERERLLQAEARARARLQRLQQATAALAAALTPDDVAAVTIEAGIRAGGAPRGRVLLVKGDEIELVASTGYEPAQLEGWTRVPRSAQLPVAEAARGAQPIVVGAPGQLLGRFPTLAPWARVTGMKATAVFPLAAGSDGARRVLGVVCFDFTEEREFAPDELQFLETLANLSAQAMDRALAYAAERAARLEAERANEAKASFLAVMSHELRTPLNAIAGYTELLEMGIHGPTTPKQLEALGRIRQNQQHLLGHINDILDFARLEAGRVTYRLEDVPVEAAVAGVAPLVEPIIAARGLTYEVQLPAGLPPVRADRERLAQVLVNLLANAAKFTERGGRIGLSASVDAERVCLRVSDTGAGIPPEKLETIFEPFVRVESTYQRRTEGAGLGLSIARDLARGMGGELTAESVLGRGSAFTVALPRASR